MKRNVQAGFSLLELLIAITLVGAISAGLLTTMRNSLRTMERTQTRLLENRTALGIQDLIRRQIGGAMPVQGFCGGGDIVSQASVFRGNVEAMLLVSNESSSEGSRGAPRVALYQVLPNPDRTVRLVVTEALFSGPAGSQPFCGSAPGAMQVPAGASSFVLFDRLAYCRFSYRNLNFNNLAGREWREDWIESYLPHTIRIDMAAAPGNTTRMPLGSVTIPLHVSRSPGERYTDVE